MGKNRHRRTLAMTEKALSPQDLHDYDLGSAKRNFAADCKPDRGGLYNSSSSEFS